MSSHHTITVDADAVGGRICTRRTLPDDEQTPPRDVARLEAEVALLRAALAAEKARRAEIIERYERLLDERDGARAPPTTDPRRHHPATGRSLVSRLRDLF